MWFMGQFENGSWGFQQEGCPPRYTSKHEVECIRDMYEALKGMMEIAELAMPDTYFQSDSRVNKTRQALAKAESI